MEKVSLQMIQTLSTTIEAKDDYARRHSHRVAEYALACLEQAIHEKIRKLDICTRYSSMQYLLILHEPDETQIPKVMDRIFQYYDTLYDKKDFIPSYEYRPILHSND